VSGRSRPATPPRDDRNYSRGNDRPAPAPAGRSSNEPWSDVPPELEALLRAQVAQKAPASRPATSHDATPTVDPDVTSGAAVEIGAPAAKTPAKPRTTRKTASTSGASKAAAKPRATRKASASSASAAAGSDDPGLAAGSANGAASEPAAKAPAKPRAARKPAATKATASKSAPDDADAAPKKRTTRKTTAPAEPV
jgi:hypothetical protein